MSEEDLQTGGDRFPPTRRSVIEAARSIDAGERERALEVLCAAYWKPVYKYVRWRWNRPAEAAQDLTQGFFAELLERELLNNFDPKKSRLRTYLRVCVDSFVMNVDKAGRRQKRGGSIPPPFPPPNRSKSFLKRNGCEAFSRWPWKTCADCASSASARAPFVPSSPTISRAPKRFRTSNSRMTTGFPSPT